MFLHETPSHYARVVKASAYGSGLVVGTALLIAVTDPEQELWHTAEGTPTHAEVVMQGALDRALASPKTAVMAATELHERRGL